MILAVIASSVICERSSSPPPPKSPKAAETLRQGSGQAVAPHVDFKKEVQPILEKKCSPCHFEGGVMHARLPFDKPETIAKLGTKLFSRIKDEESRATIRKFLSEQK